MPADGHPAYIDPASPWQNGTANRSTAASATNSSTYEQFDTLLEVQVLAEDWRIEYNTYRPHGSLDWLTPDAYSGSGSPTQPTKLS